jgi:hypothetical protein
MIAELHRRSLAELWEKIEKPIHVYYLGDHDPSGLKIETDQRNTQEGFGTSIVNWQRLVLTEEDFANSELVGFPVKKNPKNRSYWQPYPDEYGDRCVEVDAIPAIEIRARVENVILSHRQPA